MPSTFLPRQEGKLNQWLANFSEKISAAPASFGLSPADAETIAVAVEAWHTAYATAIAPNTRTGPAVIGKNDQKKIVVPMVRRYGAIIRANPDVSVELKMALGLHPPRPQGAPTSRIPAPSDAPMLALLELNIGSHTLRIMRGGASTAKVRPVGTAGMLLFRAIDDAPVRNAENARFLAFVTRAEYRSEFERGPATHGKTATYFGRWTNFKGQLGPWSNAVSMQIAA